MQLRDTGAETRCRHLPIREFCLAEAALVITPLLRRYKGGTGQQDEEECHSGRGSVPGACQCGPCLSQFRICHHTDM